MNPNRLGLAALMLIASACVEHRPTDPSDGAAEETGGNQGSDGDGGSATGGRRVETGGAGGVGQSGTGGTKGTGGSAGIAGRNGTGGATLPLDAGSSGTDRVDAGGKGGAGGHAGKGGSHAGSADGAAGQVNDGGIEIPKRCTPGKDSCPKGMICVQDMFPIAPPPGYEGGMVVGEWGQCEPERDAKNTARSDEGDDWWNAMEEAIQGS